MVKQISLLRSLIIAVAIASNAASGTEYTRPNINDILTGAFTVKNAITKRLGSRTLSESLNTIDLLSVIHVDNEQGPEMKEKIGMDEGNIDGVSQVAEISDHKDQHDTHAYHATSTFKHTLKFNKVQMTCFMVGSVMGGICAVACFIFMILYCNNTRRQSDLTVPLIVKEEKIVRSSRNREN